jgi:hypothetical protein
MYIFQFIDVDKFELSYSYHSIFEFLPESNYLVIKGFLLNFE